MRTRYGESTGVLLSREGAEYWEQLLAVTLGPGVLGWRWGRLTVVPGGLERTPLNGAVFHVNAVPGRIPGTVGNGLHQPEIDPATSMDGSLPSEALDRRSDVVQASHAGRESHTA